MRANKGTSCKAELRGFHRSWRDAEQKASILQRAVLERLTGLISIPVGDAVPAGVVALEAMRLIVEVVGEVSSDEVHQMRQPCITKLTAHPQPLQAQVSASCLITECSSAYLLCRQHCVIHMSSHPGCLWCIHQINRCTVSKCIFSHVHVLCRGVVPVSIFAPLHGGGF